jgi:hypothetical protein
MEARDQVECHTRSANRRRETDALLFEENDKHGSPKLEADGRFGQFGGALESGFFL